MLLQFYTTAEYRFRALLTDDGAERAKMWLELKEGL
jgi:hypothetical protein